MRIRILQPVAGRKFSWTPGEFVELDDDEGAKWADGVRAELVDASPPTNPDPAASTTGADDPPVPFDPTAHPTKEVLEYLGTASEQEAVRVFEAEAGGENRKGIAKVRDSVLEAARGRDQEQAARTEEQAAEKAAEASRGGGRGDVIETR